MKNENFYNFFFYKIFAKIFSKTHQIVPFFKIFSGEHAPNTPSKRVASPHAAWRKSLVLIAINLFDYGAIYCQNISARQCHNSSTVISVCDHRTEIDTQPLPVTTCYYLLRVRRHKMNHEFVPIYHNRFILSNSQLNL